MRSFWQMHPIAYKVGIYVTLCGAALFFACSCTWAQDSALNVSPVDRSVHAGLDEIDDRTEELPPSPDVSKHPQMLSRWSPQVRKQLPATTVWMGKAKVANVTGLSEDESDAAPQHKKLPKTLAVGGGQIESNVPALERGTGIGGFNRRFHFDPNLPTQTDGEPYTSLTILPVPSVVTPFHAAGMSNPFNRNPFGHENSLPFETKSVFPDQEIRKQPEAQPRPFAPGFQSPISPDPQTNQKH
jgi:hypothetical protein